HVPNEFLVSEAEVYRSLSSLQVAKSIGPDELPNKVLKEFATELSPIIQDIYNESIKEAYIPDLLKSSIISPIQKVTPPQSIESDLRPISLTCNLAKIMEEFFCRRFLSQLTRKIDPRQFARKGHSTTDALLFLLQPVYEALDSGNACARFFFANISKGFDRIDHHIQMQELMELDIHPGTKLGVILFSVMTNKLISDWHLRTKFVDDTAALEIIPRNSISYLNHTVDELHQFSVNHYMSLNPLKCKEMVINFMNNNNSIMKPFVIGSNVVERVTNYKLLGVQMSEDLKWNKHVDYIYKKLDNDENTETVNDSMYGKRTGLKGAEIASFDGKPVKWPYFCGIFSSLVNKNDKPMPAVKLAHLNSCLTDRVRAVIACLTGEPGDYDRAVKQLTERHGDPREIIDAHLRRISSWPHIKDKDREEFQRFGDALQAAVFALDKPDNRHELASIPLCTFSKPKHEKPPDDPPKTPEENKAMHCGKAQISTPISERVALKTVSVPFIDDSGG
ncbi:Hypothetical predicted protein, partial [Paramuricea clavata]